MKRTSRFIAWLLCLCLLVIMAGCQEPTTTQSTQSTQSTQATQSTQSTSPTTPTDPYLEAYQAAFAEIQNAKELSMNISRKDTVTVNGEEFTTTTNQDITYLGIGTGNFTASVAEAFLFSGNRREIDEVYIGGTAYSTADEGSLRSEMTEEEFMARYLPVQVLDVELYTRYRYEKLSNKDRIHFESGTALEAWLAPEAQLRSVQAYADLTAAGKLDSITYIASYNLIGADIYTELSVQFSTPRQTDITVPEGGIDYPLVSFLDTPKVFNQVLSYMANAHSVSTSFMEMAVMQATGVYFTYSVTSNSYFANNIPQVKITSNYHVVDNYYGEEFEDNSEEKYLDGKYTLSENGGAPTPNSGVTAYSMLNYLNDILSDNLVDCEYLTTAECTDLGSLLLIEAGFNQEYSQLLNEYVCRTLYSDPQFLDDIATSFRTLKAEYYIAVDKYLGIPTAMGINFEGQHVIDGIPYKLIYQVDQTFDLASLNTYNAVHGSPHKGSAPETPATPLFYKVTGPDGQEMWLLGTIHVGDKRNQYLPQKLLDAFTAADALAVECDSDALEAQLEKDPALQETLSNCYYYSDGTTAEDHISDPEIYQYALQLMKATGNYNVNTPYMKVATWSNSINNFFLQQSYSLSSDKGVDNLLMQMARDMDKPIYEVESSLFQIQMLTGWSEELSELLLLESLQTNAVDYRESILYLYDLWCQGDEQALSDYLNDEGSGEMTDEEQKLYDEYNNAMSVSRNADMIQKAIEYLESGETIFYAVGLAHVIAEDGLVNGLRAAGYTVELVEFE